MLNCLIGRCAMVDRWIVLRRGLTPNSPNALIKQRCWKRKTMNPNKAGISALSRMPEIRPKSHSSLMSSAAAPRQALFEAPAAETLAAKPSVGPASAPPPSVDMEAAAPAEERVAAGPAGVDMANEAQNADTLSATRSTAPHEQSNNKALPRQLTLLLEQPSLLAGENKEDYEILLAALIAALKPKDILDHIWICDVAYHQSQIRRYRQFKDSLITATRRDTLETMLQPLLSSDASDVYLDEPREARVLVSEFLLGKPAATKEVTDLLARDGLNLETVLAVGMTSRIEAIERIDRMMFAAQAGRDAAFREIERRRAVLGQKSRYAVQEIEDAEFSVVEPSSE
jgi:hypothetical protein